MSVSERKLRPIYEALDSRNAKTALKLINAALPKHKDSQLLRVLKGLALIRLDRADEAFKACDGVAAEAPTDEQVLNILSMVYKGSEHVNKLIAAYEDAVKARPQDAHLLQTLLFTQTRALQFGKAQQTAMTLHRLRDCNFVDYPWWIVTCLVLQARQAGVSGEAPKDAQKLLMLARGMAKKRLANPEAAHQYTKGGPESGEAIRLYLEVLKELKDVEEIGHFLDGPLASCIYPSDVERSLAVTATLAERGNTAQAAQAMVQLAERHGPVSWDVLQAYLEFVLPVPAAKTSLCRDPIREAPHSANGGTNGLGTSANISVDAVREAEALMQKLQQAALASDAPAAQAAAPLLACVDLENRKHLHGLADGPGISGDVLSEEELERLESGRAAGPSGHQHAAPESATNGIAAAALVYFQKLGHLASCAASLRRFMSQIQGQGRQWLASEVHRLCTIAESSAHVPEDAAVIQRRVNAYLIEHDLDLPAFGDVRQAEEYAVSLVKVFRAAVAVQKDLDQKERGISDTLIAQAVAALVTAWKMETAPKAPTYLLKAVLVVEAAQRTRPRSAPIRLAAMSLRGLLGAAPSAMESFDALDIKHIQHDTLSGHLALPIMLGALCEEGEAQLLGEARALYEHHDRDAGDTILMAFRAENWTKVLEFVRFKERLAASHARAVAYAELAVHRLTSLSTPTPATMLRATHAAADALKSDPPSGLAGLRFNEDLSTRPAWLPPHSGSSRLAIPSWWEQAAASPVSGYGRCWWAISLAAESPSSEAQQYRAGCAGSLELRRLLPTLLEAALSPEHASAAATLEGCLEHLSVLGSSERHRSTSVPGEKSALHHLLSLSANIFSAAAAVQAALATDDEARAAEASQQASQRLQALQHCVEDFFGALVPEVALACKEALFTGAALFVAGAFASEDALWLALCLQVWRQPKQAKKGKKGAEPTLSSFSGTVRSLSADLDSVHSTLAGGVKALVDQLDMSTKRTRSSKVEELCSSVHDDNTAGTEGLSHELWAWEGQLDVDKVLSGLVWEQTELVMALQGRLQNIQKLL